MTLWQGWHNTDQDRPYFHYGPMRGGGYKEQMEVLAQKHVKRNMNWEMKKAEWEFFYLIVETYVVILLF